MATTRPKRWWENAPKPYKTWNSNSKGKGGVKEDGGGSTRGQSKVGDMRIFHAVAACNANLIVQLVDADVHTIHQVDACGNTPLHLACVVGHHSTVSLLLQLGAMVNASNNAGDRPIHWAMHMEHDDIVNTLEAAGAESTKGQVLVPDNVDKVGDFYTRECWKGHPAPYADFVAWQQEKEAMRQAELSKLVPGLE